MNQTEKRARERESKKRAYCVCVCVCARVKESNENMKVIDLGAYYFFAACRFAAGQLALQLIKMTKAHVIM